MIVVFKVKGVGHKTQKRAFSEKKRYDIEFLGQVSLRFGEEK
jgi:hypothetical protein